MALISDSTGRASRGVGVLADTVPDCWLGRGGLRLAACGAVFLLYLSAAPNIFAHLQRNKSKMLGVGKGHEMVAFFCFYLIVLGKEPNDFRL